RVPDDTRRQSRLQLGRTPRRRGAGQLSRHHAFAHEGGREHLPKRLRRPDDEVPELAPPDRGSHSSSMALGSSSRPSLRLGKCSASLPPAVRTARTTPWVNSPLLKWSSMEAATAVQNSAPAFSWI